MQDRSTKLRLISNTSKLKSKQLHIYTWDSVHSHLLKYLSTDRLLSAWYMSIAVVVGSMTPFLNPAHKSVIVPSNRYNNLHVIVLVLTVVDCGNLTDPANGQVTHTAGTAFGQTATYSCNTGYNLVGSSTRTCQGNWSGSVPTCQSMLLKGSFQMCIYTRNIII